MRSYVAAALVFSALLCPMAARADAVYSLGLSGGGNGSFTLSALPSAVPGQVTTYYVAGDPNNNGVDTIESLRVLIGADTFDLTTAKEETYLQFDGGVLSAVQYASSVGSSAFQTSGLGYGYIHIGMGAAPQTGTLNASLVSSTPTAATPEPSSLFLLGSGLLGGLGVWRRRFVSTRTPSRM